MSRASELEDEARLAAWCADRALFAEILVYVLARAPKCGVGACNRVALWRWTERGCMPKDLLLCDGCKGKRAGCVAIEGSGVIRRVLARVGKVLL